MAQDMSFDMSLAFYCLPPLSLVTVLSLSFCFWSVVGGVVTVVVICQHHMSDMTIYPQAVAESGPAQAYQHGSGFSFGRPRPRKAKPKPRLSG
jgi:hypothetical protein